MRILRNRDSMEYYVEECSKVCSWFRELGKDKEEIWKKLWNEELVKCKVLGKVLG